MPRRKPDRRWLQRLQAADGVTQIGGVEIDSKIAAEQAAFREQGMPGEAHVYLSNQFHAGTHALGIQMPGVQRPVTEVIINVPDPLTVALRRHPEQGGTVITQANRRQPTSDRQLIPLRVVQLHAFDHYRADPAIEDKAQAVNARATRGKLALLEDLAQGRRFTENLLQQLTELDQPRLATVFQQVVQTFDHVRPPVFLLASSLVHLARCKSGIRPRSIGPG